MSISRSMAPHRAAPHARMGRCAWSCPPRATIAKVAKFCPLLYLLYENDSYALWAWNGHVYQVFTSFLPAYHVRPALRAVRGVSEVWRPPALPIRNRVQD
jgi:hypothetical protein